MKKTESELVYLDTSIFAGSALRRDAEDEKCRLLIEKIRDGKLSSYEFVTSIFTLVELADVISRRQTEEKAKALLFDVMNDPDLPIYFADPEPAHKTWKGREYFDIDVLIRNFLNTTLKYRLPGFDTIHAHTVRKLDKKVIAVSKDKHFGRFEGLNNVVSVVNASDFLQKYQ